jgi:hypothetical protein
VHHLNNSTELVFLSFRPRNGDAADFRIEFNPSKVGPSGVDEIDKVLRYVFPEGWDTVLDHSSISRVDVTVDLLDVNMDQFLFMAKKGTWRSVWSTNGKLETLLYGKPGSNQWSIYDKTTEQKAKGIVMQTDVVRVERVLRNTKLSLKQLKDLPNPYKDLVISEIMPPCPDWEDFEKWSTFLDRVLVRGVHGALARLNHNKRAKYREYLKSQTCPWWEPGLLWKSWPQVSASLL